MRKVLFIFGLAMLAMSCRKQQPVIPNTPIDLYIDTKLPSNIKLNIVGGWMYFSAGYKGLIVYRQSQEKFVTYERACPYDPTDECSIVEVTSDNITAVDSCCGSQYLITDGNIIKGPSTYLLQQYQTTFDGTIVHVYN